MTKEFVGALTNSASNWPALAVWPLKDRLQLV